MGLLEQHKLVAERDSLARQVEGLQEFLREKDRILISQRKVEAQLRAQEEDARLLAQESEKAVRSLGDEVLRLREDRERFRAAFETARQEVESLRSFLWGE